MYKNCEHIYKNVSVNEYIRTHRIACRCVIILELNIFLQLHCFYFIGIDIQAPSGDLWLSINVPLILAFFWRSYSGNRIIHSAYISRRKGDRTHLLRLELGALFLSICLTVQRLLI